MFGRILNISNNHAKVELSGGSNVDFIDVNPEMEIGTGLTTDIMNMHVVFENGSSKVLGEVDNIDGSIVTIRFLGEIVDNKLLGGVLRKPTLDSTVRFLLET